MRPLLPSRATYWIWFGWAAILTFGMLGYLLWAYSRGLVGLREAWLLEMPFVIGGLICGIVGAAFRWRWLKKQDALRGYQRMLAAAFDDK